MRRLRVFAVLLFLAPPLAVACDDPPEPAAATADAGVVRVPASPTLEAPPPDASLPQDGDAGCNPIAEAVTILPAAHVADAATPLFYPTNPPSSGTHYTVWANFQVFDKPVPDGYLVHSMEHGAVVLFYKCEPATCPSVIAGLRAIRDAVPTDPACALSERVRVIIVPRAELDVPIAAAAWGFTYRAQCIDAPSLKAFIAEHYGKTVEDFCDPGLKTF